MLIKNDKIKWFNNDTTIFLTVSVIVFKLKKRSVFYQVTRPKSIEIRGPQTDYELPKPLREVELNKEEI